MRRPSRSLFLAGVVGLASTGLALGGLAGAGPAAAASSKAPARTPVPPAPALTNPLHRSPGIVLPDGRLSPRTHFTMAPDGSSGKTQSGAGIPNIDSTKSTIRTYYNAGSDGIANKSSSPYITQITGILARETTQLPKLYAQAKRTGKTPAIVFDTDDTTLWTYDFEDGEMHFVFDPVANNNDVQAERFPAVPAMTTFVAAARKAGFAVFGITGRNTTQKAATLGNLAKVGYGNAFSADRFYTKWTGAAGDPQPSYIHCATTTCTTVEYKAGTRAHIESQGFDIALNLGDQWSDLQGRSANHVLKLPNPTYYLPSPDLPGLSEPKLAPRTRFTMRPDGSSGTTQGGEGIPNIDSVKSTVRAYYAATAGVADKTSSPYISEMSRITRTVSPTLDAACSIAKRYGLKPAIVLDADDTTLWTYDVEDSVMHFNYNPAVSNTYVLGEKFPAVPGMVALVNSAHAAGCTLVGLTGRPTSQQDATLGNLAKVGYTGFTPANYYTKPAAGSYPSYLHCAAATCTTSEYKSQTRAHVESASGGGYTVLANFGDQFSDLLGGHAFADVKLPNPTYYLP